VRDKNQDHNFIGLSYCARSINVTIVLNVSILWENPLPLGENFSLFCPFVFQNS